MPTADVDFAAAYCAVQERLLAVVLDQPVDRFDLPVPSCPGWTLWHLLAHLTGGMVDASTGNTPELVGLSLHDYSLDPAIRDAVEAMTRRQIDERRGRRPADLAEEWTEATVTAMPMLRGEEPFPPPLPPFMEYTLLEDVAVHEDDAREALGLGPAPPSAAREVALVAYVVGLDRRLRSTHHPALRLVADQEEFLAGEGEPMATLTASTFELVMTLSGRRSPDQIRALEWDGDAKIFVDSLPEY
jgi:uncharacterized protein (TIGR03083 family)